MVTRMGSGRIRAVQLAETVDPAEFFAGHPSALAVCRKTWRIIAPLGTVEMRTSKSYVAFRRRVAFGWLWLPGRWLRRPTSETVLSIALPRHLRSHRFKEVAHPSRKRWIHHLEVRSTTDIDREVAAWLAEAFEHAA